MNHSNPILSGVSRATLSLLSAALIVFLIPSIFVLPAELVLFQPYTYKRALENARVYDQFPELLSKALVQSGVVPATPGMGQQAISYLNQDDYTRFFAMVLPKTWLKNQSESIIQNFGDFMNFRRDDLSLVVDLREIKTNLAGDQGNQIAGQIVQSWPECTQEDVGKILGLTLSGQLQGIPICRPPDMMMPAFEEVVRGSLQTMTSSLPDQLDLATALTTNIDLPGASGPLVPHWWDIFRWYTVLRWLFRLTPVFALAVLVWIVLLTIRSRHDLLHGTGQPLFMSGLIAFLLALLLIFILNPVLSQVISNAFPLLPAAFRGIVAGMLLEVGNRFGLWSAFLALVVGVTGLGLLLSERFFERGEDLSQYPG